MHMTRPEQKMGNALAKGAAGRDLGKACLNCRFYDESRGTDLAVCKRHKIRTYIAASCKEYDGKNAG